MFELFTKVQLVFNKKKYVCHITLMTTVTHRLRVHDIYRVVTTLSRSMTTLREISDILAFLEMKLIFKYDKIYT